MARSVSFSSLVSVADAYGSGEYKREGYKRGEAKKWWKCERIKHDRDANFFYCEIHVHDGDESGSDTDGSGRGTGISRKSR
jgi:hypothetical protein